MRAILQFWKDDAGQGLPEYALLVAAVVVMTIAAVGLFTGSVRNVFNDVGTYVSDNGTT